MRHRITQAWLLLAVSALSMQVPLRGAAPSRTVNDFDGDGKTDDTVYRPSTGQWFVLKSSSQFTTLNVYRLGGATDIPVAGDYDGDGQTDVAVYRPSTGKWLFLKSSTNYTTLNIVSWGMGKDIPVPGDYDGDGKTDIAVFRPSIGGWFILRSSTNNTSWVAYQWSLGADLPVPADYDGDGHTDVALFRPSTGSWFILTSASNYTAWLAYQWGDMRDIAVPGDYDGDGHADIAIFRPSNGVWFVRMSSTSFTTWNQYWWGMPGDKPEPGDYDGDGKTDLAIFRPSSGSWFILKSSSNYTNGTSYQWGAGTDTPVPNLSYNTGAAFHWQPGFQSPGGQASDGAIQAFTVFDDGSGTALYAGGLFSMVGGVPANSVAKWNGNTWSPLGNGLPNCTINGMAAFDDGTGPTLFVAATGIGVAKWNGTTWTTLGFPQQLAALTLAVFDDGTGPALYAATATLTGLQGAVEKWNGTAWTAVGSGLPFNGPVDALTVFDDGTGPALYAAGEFTIADGVAANRIAKWDGTRWAPLGGGITTSTPFVGVRALAVYDDGTGPALYAGGVFNLADGRAANNIAKWDGTAWSPLGDGTGFNQRIFALAPFDDGTGPALYVGGQSVQTAGGGPVRGIARWDGTIWLPLGTGISGGNNTVVALASFNDGTGPALYAAGGFNSAGGQPSKGIAKWSAP